MTASSDLQLPRPQSLQPLPEHAQCVYTGKIFSVYQWQQELYDGTTAVFEKVKRADTVSVIPVLPDKRIVVTFEQQPSLKPFCGTVGGVMDTGEAVGAAAVRELREETGLVSEHWQPWFALQPVTKIEWVCHYVIARECQRVSGQSLDPGEKIQLQAVTFDEFLEIAVRDDFRDTALTMRVLKARQSAEKLAEFKRTLLGD